LFQLLNVLKEGEEAPAGYCHFPEYAPEYFKQLTAEQLVSKVVKGYTKQEWQKVRERNEVLDCRIYARAASIALGIDRWPESKWNSLSEKTASKKSKKIVKSRWIGEQ
ncbi:MAG: phage terminase large subunit family protein, partial [Wolbachia endosymbiont of Pissodes strobi]|nr:phage terminase large subunit family protein [Wolbachia endosymbiont of Pissodes strobi]